MSLSNPREILERPANKYVKFNGGTGKLTYYEKFDKEDPRYSEKKKGEEVEINIDGAIILDADLFCVTGFEKNGRGYCYSNEVRNASDELSVRFFSEKKVASKGTWKEIKEHMGEKIVRFTKCVYLWLDEEIIHMQIFGMSLNSWIKDIASDRKAQIQKTIKVKEIKTEDEGQKSEYKYMVFGFGDKIDPEDLKKAESADRVVQEYLKKYFDKNGTAVDSDGSGSPEDHHEQNDGDEQTYDTSEWRSHTSACGVLGDCPMSAIKNDQVQLEESGNVDNKDYAMICQALKEYEDAQKSWDERKDKSGKLLKDYTLEELKSTYDMLMEKAPRNPARLHVEAAYCAMLDQQEQEEDLDEIPF